ncbi:MAG: class D sortase [Anaerolineae bacterium]|nr:class D sortase [Anaerolineae bacterium]
MRDKRPVDELSVEELERILAIKKREERQQKLKRMERSGRIVESKQPPPASPPPPTLNFPTATPVAAAPTAPPPTVQQPVVREVSPRFEDDAETYNPETMAGKSRFWRSFFNQSLLLVEVVAVVGLVFLGYQMLTAINTLQKETASAQAMADEQRRETMPTLIPTPQIRLSQVVLPGGHIFTTSGEVQFNYAEIPEALRGLVATEVLAPVISRPQITRETALELSIPKLGIEQSIVQGTDWEALKLGVGQLLNNVNPGDVEGNLVLSGHNDIYGEVFRYLDQLEVGDEFFVRTQTQIHTYRITGTDIVDPSDISVLSPRGGAVATLISCYPFRVNDKRYIVFAERVV